MRQSLRGRRIATLVVAVTAGMVAASVYSSTLPPRFIPLRVEVVATPIDSLHRVVTIVLPDVSSFRGQTVVVGVQLRNNVDDQRQIGLLRDGFPKQRVFVPPHRTSRWDIVLEPETVAALDNERGDGARSLELTGDADGWALTSLEVRNYHSRWGDRVMAVVLPNRDGTAPGISLPAAIALCLLALASALVYPRQERRTVRLLSAVLAATSLVVFTTCPIVALASPYRVQLSRSAFFVLAAGLFSPLAFYVLAAAPALAVTLPSLVTGSWKRHEQTFERAAAVFGLAAVAIAQPIFEVVSNSPEFFAARGTTPEVAIAGVLIMCFGVPCLVIGIERAIRAVSPRAAAAVHGVALAALAAGCILPWFRHTDDVISASEGAVAVLAGIVVAGAYGRTRIVRQFTTALAPAALVVPALFVLNPDVQRSFLPSESAAAVGTLARTPPIVLVVFDELPLNSLLDASGAIDAGRYPNFAALARESSWFRNATTVWHNTDYAVPAIVSGRYPAGKAVPTLRYYPVNVFTALARHYDIVASMRFQQLCPPRACRDNSAMPGDTVRSLVTDLSLVWLHIVLPQPLAGDLPPVDVDWAEFGDATDTAAGQGRTRRGVLFAQFVAAIDARPARLYFIHSMVPHMPFDYVPSGRRYRVPAGETRNYRAAGLFEGRSAAFADTLHQRHLAQVGFVDRLVGDLIARLRDTGVYDEALVIVTADHGASYREGRSRRLPQPGNVSDVVGVPLFVKLPGQQRGEVIDRVVETVDIFPTILDTVGAKASLRIDGRPLFDEEPSARPPQPFLLRARYTTPPTETDVAADRAASLERKERRFGKGDSSGLYAPPAFRHLLGIRMTRPATPPDVQITIRDSRQFTSVKRGGEVLPLYVHGVLDTARPDPLTVAVVVNGTVAAVTQSYRDRKTHLFGVLIPEASLREGDNEVSAAIVNDTGAR